MADAMEILERFLAEAPGRRDGLEALCARHPEVASELTELWERYRRTSSLLDGLGEGGDAAKDFPVGTRYELLGEIALGGMGRVLEVWDPEFRRKLAMKVLRDAAQVPDGSSRARRCSRLLNEAQVLGQLEHPGIVPVHDVGRDDDGRPYFTMLRVQGRTLEEVFSDDREACPIARAVGILLRVCEAVAHAHARGVVHRDLKPANVMVGPFNEVFVMDWGLAKAHGRDVEADIRLESVGRSGGTTLPGSDFAQPASAAALDESVWTDRREEHEVEDLSLLMTLEGDVVGTPAYMAPEQAEGRVADVDERSDIYSAGAMLYHLLAGRPPYVDRAASSTPREVLAAVLAGEPEPLARIAPKAARELAAVCSKAMARDREERYASMQALSADLRAYLEGRVVQAHRVGPLVELRKWIERNRAVAVSAALLLTLSIGWLATSAWLTASKARELLRMSDHKRLADLVAKADELWPLVPERAGAMRAWIVDAKEVVGRIPVHEQVLARLAKGRRDPLLEAQWFEARAAHEAELDAARQAVADARAALQHASDGGERANAADLARAGLVRKERTLARLERGPPRRPPPDLRTDGERWQYESTWELVRQLRAFSDPTDGLIADVRGRLQLVEGLREATLTSAHARRAWGDAVSSIRDEQVCPMYDGLQLEPMAGLLPIGRDPVSGLWEFVHVGTGAAPPRDADGVVRLEEASGVVLVLLPGGLARLGAQTDDPDLPFYSPEADPALEPLREVGLRPFFISKFEMTQGQWQRLTGDNPSEFCFSPVHPVDSVSWNDCAVWLPRVRLALPSQDEWEYATRAGAVTPWACGAEASNVATHANVLDQTAFRTAGVGRDAPMEAWSDGFGHTAPVGSFSPNAFGLYDCHGNLSEWVREYRQEAGGSWAHTARAVRASRFRTGTPDSRSQLTGVRPAMQLPQHDGSDRE